MSVCRSHCVVWSAAALGFVACGPVETLSTSVPSKIIGESSLIAVEQGAKNIPQKLRSIVGAIGRMNMGCTATHIGNGIAVTAGHCFSGVATTFEQTNLPCGDVTVEWGVLKEGAPTKVSKCKKIMSIQVNADLDYAILKLDVAPSAAVSIDTSRWPSPGMHITVLGYPQKRSLEWSQLCELRSGFEGKFGKFMFSHQCDTEHGNSGSPVLEESSLKLVGIHKGGVTPWNSATFLKATPVLDAVKRARH